MHQITLFQDKKSKNFSRKRAQPPPSPQPQWGGGHPLLTPHVPIPSAPTDNCGKNRDFRPISRLEIDDGGVSSTISTVQ